MDRIAFLTLAVRDPRYITQQARLIESIKKHHPEAKIFRWTNCYPWSAQPHERSQYGFKVHAVNEAISEGFTKIMWIDTACILQGGVEPIFDLCKKYGVVAAKDDNKLYKYCAPWAWDYYKQEVNTSFHLVGGSMFAFDLGVPLCGKVFKSWERAEAAGMFGNKDTREGHRHDESCMALSLYANGSEPTPYPEAYYNDVPNALIIKKHFK